MKNKLYNFLFVLVAYWNPSPNCLKKTILCVVTPVGLNTLYWTITSVLNWMLKKTMGIGIKRVDGFKTVFSFSFRIPLEAYLGPLGMVGETAFHGVNTVFEPIQVNKKLKSIHILYQQKGEVALVTGAAGLVIIFVFIWFIFTFVGAVGTNVTQLLKVFFLKKKQLLLFIWLQL